jgi:hypothetical protein
MPGVTTLPGKSSPRDPDDDHWLRRQAVQLAAQLPDDDAKALRVLCLMRRLVVDFLNPRPSPPS